MLILLAIATLLLAFVIYVLHMIPGMSFVAKILQFGIGVVGFIFYMAFIMIAFGISGFLSYLVIPFLPIDGPGIIYGGELNTSKDYDTLNYKFMAFYALFCAIIYIIANYLLGLSKKIRYDSFLSLLFVSIMVVTFFPIIVPYVIPGMDVSYYAASVFAVMHFILMLLPNKKERYEEYN
ncbi:hypothetical protein HNQ35_000773 [Cerasibacillus quisquiliarum]|uniref:Uncharacterized protein n=1 Tax=Cerasibacillus quisquiliarum TaxID=227865 RepID=A0A511UZZ1_9BACI|nr:hypothetical protein [Cerasibacillus quisquiliarum]MBB5145581.1 hypothetical protein [Cerasibacillus quisquiliarum]GEN31023.1 hypothetical protein CQU01_12610 [Cerasibacillus quisquiliarum]